MIFTAVNDRASSGTVQDLTANCAGQHTDILSSVCGFNGNISDMQIGDKTVCRKITKETHVKRCGSCAQGAACTGGNSKIGYGVTVAVQGAGKSGYRSPVSAGQVDILHQNIICRGVRLKQLQTIGRVDFNLMSEALFAWSRKCIVENNEKN